MAVKTILTAINNGTATSTECACKPEIFLTRLFSVYFQNGINTWRNMNCLCTRSERHSTPSPGRSQNWAMKIKSRCLSRKFYSFLSFTSRQYIISSKTRQKSESLNYIRNKLPLYTTQKVHSKIKKIEKMVSVFTEEERKLQWGAY